jgi:hypothetical protein
MLYIYLGCGDSNQCPVLKYRAQKPTPTVPYFTKFYQKKKYGTPTQNFITASTYDIMTRGQGL